MTSLRSGLLTAASLGVGLYAAFQALDISTATAGVLCMTAGAASVVTALVLVSAATEPGNQQSAACETIDERRNERF